MAGFADRSLPEVLAAVAARSPAPGGGSSSAWAGALAAALLQMAAAFAGDEAIAARGGVLRAALLECGERELSSYAPVLDAVRLPADDPARAERLEAALADASRTPSEIARLCAEVAEFGAGVAAASKPALRGDAIAGVLIAEAACQAAARLVEINLSQAAGDPRVAEVQELARGAAAARVRALGG